MDEPAILRDRIGLLLGESVVQTPLGRALTGPPAQAVVAEIAQTQLPRLLALTNDRGEVATLCVRAGRILMFHAPTSDSILGPDASVLGQILREAEDTSKAAARIMARFVDASDAVWVQSNYVTEALEEAETGLALPELRAQTPGCSGGLAGFVDQCRPTARAVLWADAQTQFLCTGPEADLAILSDLAAAELAEGAIDPNPSCVILGGPVVGGQGVLCGRFEGALVFVVIPAEMIGQIMRLWRAALGQVT